MCTNVGVTNPLGDVNVGMYFVGRYVRWYIPGIQVPGTWKDVTVVPATQA